MRRTRATRTLALIGSAALAVTALTGVPANAAASDVQITELLYHAADADLTYGALEFLEVHNAGSEPVDVGGWEFTAGIAGTTLPAGTTIPAGGYLVGTNNAALFQDRFGFAAGFEFLAGEALSNGGETVTLSDAATNEIDTVTYDDLPPWPVAPDGSGPSLELDPGATDNSMGANWHASAVDFGTPGAANSARPLALTGVAPSTTSPDPGADVT
ncbi:MAG: lamin tail domain-containing protein, partial [Tetrasphaera sp.]|nr:lamin tail domain-containing protein [Tetrasphaera sp.]